MPSSRATASAVPRLSPEIIATSRPSSLSAATAVRADRLALEQAGVPDGEAVSADGGLQAVTGDPLELGRLHQFEVALARGGHDRRGERMLRSLLGTRDEAQQLVLGSLVGDDEVGDRRLAA